MRGFLIFAIRILVSAALLYLALRGVNFAEIQLRLKESGLGWLLGWMVLAVLVNLLQVILGAIRWQLISADCGAPLGRSQALRYNMIGTFFNQTLPSTIGGDAVRLWLVSRTGTGWRAATYSVLVDRAIGFIALAIVVFVSLPWSYQIIDDDNGRQALAAIDSAALAASVGFLLLGNLPWLWLKRIWPTRHVYACSQIVNRAIVNYPKGTAILLLSIAVHFLSAVIAWCAVRSISAPANFEQVLLVVPPIALITMLPISIAGWGVREAMMMIAFGYAGLIPADGTMVSLLTGVSSFIIGALGGLVWIASGEKTAKLTDKIHHRE
ncbi:lysylphosphatidylglycerol synthase transmembrane domain-containing protein [Bradyrhizobium sp. JYMT SZCCT0428]|uniref:lysylphosphatidylglycerol synthase transmembrane domain-containing protein n=1 Tax=Bradyrhizobium sp. JYMT SZCCT0428 TaxID=2807673 RepID=UPI001BA672DE|nr:lysylphosphatidylglycerol synthase transmembrane domain-containing protein [Bradyrhizobium sp. JYMT SZCCT0428]MBR1156992.1 flippase-like domain-containing protein [Bradyrhizobium sp. JYMT SZCCT0428]